MCMYACMYACAAQVQSLRGATQGGRRWLATSQRDVHRSSTRLCLASSLPATRYKQRNNTTEILVPKYLCRSSRPTTKTAEILVPKQLAVTKQKHDRNTCAEAAALELPKPPGPGPNVCAKTCSRRDMTHTCETSCCNRINRTQWTISLRGPTPASSRRRLPGWKLAIRKQCPLTHTCETSCCNRINGTQWTSWLFIRPVLLTIACKALQASGAASCSIL